MVQTLKDSGALTSVPVERAMAGVPRHRFLPEVDLEAAYADEAVMVKRDAHGKAISSASQPAMVAIMLELLGVTEGDRVLEIGTGTGYNAALLAAIVGEDGEVVGIELEPDLAGRATSALAAVGAGQVCVVVGDGREGWGPRAPYDRIIVTTGAREIAPAWKDQLRDGGRLVTPLVDDRGIGWVVAFDLDNGTPRPRAKVPCRFLPLRPSEQPQSGRGGR